MAVWQREHLLHLTYSLCHFLPLFDSYFIPQSQIKQGTETPGSSPSPLSLSDLICTEAVCDQISALCSDPESCSMTKNP